MKVRHDEKYAFISMFNPENGFYLRSGILDKDGIDTGTDPFMSSYPELLDVGIMQTCACAHRCNVDCYQKAVERTGKKHVFRRLRDNHAAVRRKPVPGRSWRSGRPRHT